MNIGILGAGVVAQTIAKHVLPFGHRVLLSNRRGGDSLAALVRELGSGATAGTPQQAAERTRPCSSSNWTDARSPGRAGADHGRHRRAARGTITPGSQG